MIAYTASSESCLLANIMDTISSFFQGFDYSSSRSKSTVNIAHTSQVCPWMIRRAQIDLSF